MYGSYVPVSMEFEFYLVGWWAREIWTMDILVVLGMPCRCFSLDGTSALLWAGIVTIWKA